MSFTVYGVRRKGDAEVRYVGQTSHSPQFRFRGLMSEHSSKWGREWHGDDFGRWLRENDAELEAFAIAKCDTRTEAKATEQVVIALCLRLNHRLFNGDHVPTHLRNGRGSFEPIGLVA